MGTELDKDAQEYVDILASTPNGWGQNVSSTGEISHSVLRRMQRKHGKQQFDTKLDELFRRK